MHQLGKGEVRKKDKGKDDVQFIDKWGAWNRVRIRLQFKNAAQPGSRLDRHGTERKFHRWLIKP